MLLFVDRGDQNDGLGVLLFVLGLLIPTHDMGQSGMLVLLNAFVLTTDSVVLFVR